MSLADQGITTSIKEMTMAVGTKMWESKMFTEGQMVAWENKTPVQQTWPKPSSTVLFPNFDDQLCNWSTIELQKNGAKRKCEVLKSCQAQMQAPRPGKRVVQDNALKPWGRL
jgi:hypothetical protein